MKIGIISLGCDKNRVDTEKMLARIVAGGHTIVPSEQEADIIIINTCAFIDSSKEESINEILNAVEYKKQSPSKKIIVTGCLSQRYLEELKIEIEEVDAFLGYADYDCILDTIEKVSKNEKVFLKESKDNFYCERILTTPYHYAYLKIADGCNNFCTYCAIPNIRGRYKSEKLEDLLIEAKKLSDNGVKELILVAQDVTRYGIDFDGKSHLIELLKELEKLDFTWIRLLYLEPEMVTDELIDYIKNSKKVVKYVDIPLQHVSSSVLKRMNRHTNYESTVSLIRKLKASGISIRTTFIIGFPGETEDDFSLLCDFIKQEQLNYAGFFTYSKEEGTPAFKMKGQIPDDIKQNRANYISKIQNKILKSTAKSYIGKKVKVIYDDIDYDKQLFVGRMENQTPDIDNIVYFTSNEEVQIGEYYNVIITGVKGIDLLGRVE